MKIGNKIKEKRTLLMLTQQELANRCELTKGYISQLENDKVSPSIETLSLILEVLGISLSDFFKDTTNSLIVYSKEEQYETNFTGYNQTWLVPSAQNKQMEPIVVELEPKSETFHDYPHPGEEFGYVIKGDIFVVHGSLKKECKEGESFYFVSDSTHYLINNSDSTSVVIWVSTPPNF